MGKYLKSYKKYPAGSLLVSKKYSIWKRLWYAVTGKRKPYNDIFVLPKETYIGITKFEKFINDYHIFIPISNYRHSEITKLKKLLKSCKNVKDYLVAINEIRPGTIDIDNLDNLRSNNNYYKIYIEQEPFQDVKYVS